MKYRLIEDVSAPGAVASDITSSTFDIGSVGADAISVQAVVTNSTGTAKTFQAGVAATLVNQSLTYTAVTQGTAGNSITVRYLNPGVDGVLAVAVVASAITVTLATDSGGLITSTGNDVKAAVNADLTAAALVLVSGTNASVVTALSATPLAGGLNSVVSVPASTVTITSHGMYTGEKIALTTAGTLPNPLTSTDYYIIRVDADTLKFATTKVNALAGTAVTLTTSGSGVGTLTPAALGTSTLQLYKSNDGTNWLVEGSSVSITTTGSYATEKDRPLFRYYRYVIAIGTGVLTTTTTFLARGDVT